MTKTPLTRYNVVGDPRPITEERKMAYKGLIEEYVRRPLVELTKAEKADLFFTLDAI